MRAKIFLFGLMAILILATCDVVTTDIEEEGDNPVDPENPDYEPPDVSVFAGLHQGDTLFQDNITVKWRGNNKKCEYSYNLDKKGWSSWKKNSVAKFNYLNEGHHQFLVKARYNAEDVQEEPVIIDFYVDAIQGPALWIRDKMNRAGVRDTLTAEIVSEEVTELAMSSLQLSFEPQHIHVLDCRPAANSELLEEKDIINTIQCNNIDGTLSAYLGLTMQNQAALTGSGAIFLLTIETLHTGTTIISFGDECSFRTINDEEIPINEKERGIVEIE